MRKLLCKVEYLNDQIKELVSGCNHKTLAIWAADCAKRTLLNFEDENSEDNHPRLAVEAACLWTEGKIKVSEAKKAALASHASARLTTSDSAVASARACGHAAATVHVKTHSIAAASYAARSVGFAGGDINAEREWQYAHLLELFKPI